MLSLRKSAEAIGPMTLTGNLEFVKVPQNHTRLFKSKRIEFWISPYGGIFFLENLLFY